MVNIMKNLMRNSSFLIQVVVVALATSFISAAPVTSKAQNVTTRAFAKTNPSEIRKTLKQQMQRSGGVYQTQAFIQTALDNKQKINANALLQPRLRAEKNGLQSFSTSAFGFEVFDASVFLIGDQDNDGFYSDFDIEMDVDIDSGTANVFAEIYFLNSNGDWQFLSSTAVFSITDNLASDSFTTAITLVDGFPDNYYDLLIDIYEEGIPGIVATIEASDDADLALVPLEDLNFDSNFNTNELILQQLSMGLFDDYDLDGFYSEFDLEISLENQTFGRRLQAVLYSRDTVTNWFLETSTASVFVNRGESVTYTISGDWNTGYVTDYYDFLVEIVDVDSGEVVADFGPEYNALFERPMESDDFDSAIETIIIVEDGYSSGSTDWMFVLILMLALITRITTQSKLSSNKQTLKNLQ